VVRKNSAPVASPQAHRASPPHRVRGGKTVAPGPRQITLRSTTPHTPPPRRDLSSLHHAVSLATPPPSPSLHPAVASESSESGSVLPDFSWQEIPAAHPAGVWLPDSSRSSFPKARHSHQQSRDVEPHLRRLAP
jgi:hypothetical protein